MYWPCDDGEGDVPGGSDNTKCDPQPQLGRATTATVQRRHQYTPDSQTPTILPHSGRPQPLFYSQ